MRKGISFGMQSLVAAFVVAVVPDAIPGGSEDQEAKRRELHQYLQGRYVFQKHCTICHGETGRGDGPWAADLTDKPRNFRSGLYKFRTTAYGTLPTDEDLKRTIRKGISGTAMPFFKDLSEAEVDSLIVYLKSLSRDWEKEEVRPRPLEMPGAPDWFHRGSEREKHERVGAELFATHCAVCHGEEGHGDGPGGAALVDAWENAIRPAKLSEPHHKSGDAPSDLYRSIATGLNGTPMLGYDGTLKPEEIWELVCFIQSLSKEENGRETASLTE